MFTSLYKIVEMRFKRRSNYFVYNSSWILGDFGTKMNFIDLNDKS